MSFPEEALRLRLSEALGRELLGESTHELHRAMTHALLAGGKRMRPMLTCLWGQRYGAHEDDLIQAGLAVEWVHTYSLVHDDLPCMDDDDLRRGQPTVHKVFGEAMGVLCGDALLTDAFAKLAALEHTSAERRLAAIARLARGAGSQGMVLGQVEDLAAMPHHRAGARGALQENRVSAARRERSRRAARRCTTGRVGSSRAF